MCIRDSHYDDLVLCMEGNDYSLATACVTFEPRKLKFTEKIPVTLTIPDYTEIRKRYPNAKPQFLCGDVDAQSKESFDWEVVSDEEFTISQNDGQCVATIQSTNFGPLKGIWSGVTSVNPNLGPKHEYRKSIAESNIKSISARCQAFMSPITRTGSESLILFNVAVLVYPFQAFKAYENLENYECSLCDSCLLYTSPSPRDATLSRMPSSA